MRHFISARSGRSSLPQLSVKWRTGFSSFRPAADPPALELAGGHNPLSTRLTWERLTAG